MSTIFFHKETEKNVFKIQCHKCCFCDITKTLHTHTHAHTNRSHRRKSIHMYFISLDKRKYTKINDVIQILVSCSFEVVR